eukprot:1164341-Rhodomonas_salina.1
MIPRQKRTRVCSAGGGRTDQKACLFELKSHLLSHTHTSLSAHRPDPDGLLSTEPQTLNPTPQKGDIRAKKLTRRQMRVDQMRVDQMRELIR